MRNQDIIKQSNEAFIDEVLSKREIRRDEIRNKRIRVGALRGTSYLFQIFSVLTASYAVYHYAADYTGFHIYVVWAAAIMLLILNELGKRFAILSTAQGVYNTEDANQRGWVVLIFITLAASMTVSYHGGDKFVSEENKGATLVHNASIDSISLLIAEQDQAIKILSTSKWKGVLTRGARDGINSANKIKAGLIQEKIRLSQRDEKENDGLLIAHNTKFSRFGAIFGGVAALLDLLLIAFLFWAEKDETDVERFANRTQKNPTQKRSVPSDATTERPNLRVIASDMQLDRVTAQIIAQSQQISELRDIIQEVATQTVNRPTDATPSVSTQKLRRKKKPTVKKADGKRYCLNCDADISQRTARAKYCCDACRKDFHDKK